MRAHLSMVEVEVEVEVEVSVGLHVDSAMPCCYLVAWRDADRGPACRWIPAWIAANHRAIVQAIGCSYLVELVERGDFARRGRQGGGGWGGGMPGTGAGAVYMYNSPSYPSQIFLLKLST